MLYLIHQISSKLHKAKTNKQGLVLGNKQTFSACPAKHRPTIVGVGREFWEQPVLRRETGATCDTKTESQAVETKQGWRFSQSHSII